jgi:hypothetical protein
MEYTKMKHLFNILLLCISFSAFSQAPDYPAASAIGTIQKAEYFFDTDPGINNGIAIAITPALDIANFTTTINLQGSALTNGIHRIYIRTQDNSGRWSLTQTAIFDNVLVPLYPSNPGSAVNITDVEYFFNNDPGIGMGKKITVPNQNDINSFNALIDLSGLTPGSHRLFVRSKDVSGKWSLIHFAVFDNTAIMPYPSAPAAALTLTSAEYFFDVDPGFGNGTSITLPVSTDINGFSIDIPVNTLTRGPHTLYLRSKASPWSLTAYADFSFASTLPVTWLYVRAEVLNKDAQISWATGSEENAKKFILEHSKDGQKFISIGEVAAKNASTGHSYNFKHLQPGAGVHYYRIKQMDQDGKATYSKVMTLLFSQELHSPILFPNPATTIVHIANPAGLQLQSIELFDAWGRLIKTERPNNQQTISVSVHDIKSGHYLIVVKGDKGRTVHPFVKN